MSAMERFIDTFFKPSVIASTWPKILDGMLVTVELALAVVISGLAVGLLLALIRTAQIRLVNAVIIVLVDVLRAVPPLVMVLIVYFGLPNVGLTLPSFAVLWLVLAAVLAAFGEEIFWAGILSVRRGQWDAARSTGLTFIDTLAFVVLPQTIRMVLPPLVNRTIAISKNTALGTVIGVPELLNQATTAVSFISNATPLSLAAIGYLIIFLPVVLLGSWLERRFAFRKA
jgi:polar amino acid transport system permease protein